MTGIERVEVLQGVAFDLGSAGRRQISEKLENEAGMLAWKASGCVVFDGIFDVFFEGYWERYTTLKTLAVRLRVHGRGEVRVFRRVAGEDGKRLVCREAFAGTKQIVLPVPLSGARNGWLELSIDGENGLQVEAVEWVTQQQPARNPSITAVICTFNREDYVARNLAKLAAGPRFLKRIVVVNHGAPGIAERVRPATVDDGIPIEFIDQDNEGGAGGFTRGLLSCLDDLQATHSLLMDDDVEVDPRILSRLGSIAAYLENDMCLGGAMMDIFERDVLFSCGDRLVSGRPQIVNVAPEKSDPSAQTAFLAQDRDIDFNGWWCFLIPLAACRQFGLPYPFFIRGDDVEFGYRLQRQNVSTVCWPGVALWHLPFRLKQHHWHVFYDRRNMMFLAESSRKYSRINMMIFFVGRFAFSIIKYDYIRCEMMLRGLQEYNAGWERLAQWGGSDHAALVAHKDRRSNTVDPTLPIADPSLEMKTIPRIGLALGRIVSDMIRSSAREPGSVMEAGNWSPWLKQRPDAVYLDDGEGGYVVRQRSRSQSRILWSGALRAIGKFLIRPNSGAERLRYFRSEEFWRYKLSAASNGNARGVIRS